MAQLSIRVGSPAVCSPASCFTAIKYHQGRAKERGKEQRRREGGEENIATPGFRKKAQERGQIRGMDKVDEKREVMLRKVWLRDYSFNNVEMNVFFQSFSVS